MTATHFEVKHTRKMTRGAGYWSSIDQTKPDHVNVSIDIWGHNIGYEETKELTQTVMKEINNDYTFWELIKKAFKTLL